MIFGFYNYIFINYYKNPYYWKYPYLLQKIKVLVIETKNSFDKKQNPYYQNTLLWKIKSLKKSLFMLKIQSPCYKIFKIPIIIKIKILIIKNKNPYYKKPK